MSSLPLSGPGYDRAAERRGDERWLADAWARGRVVQITAKSAALVGSDDQLAVLPCTRVEPDVERRFLGVVDDVPYFAVTVEPEAAAGSWQTLRDVGTDLDDLGAAMFTAAIGLEQWHQRHRHCPLCGEPTVETLAGWTRTCPRDGTTHFPRTDPAVIMLVTDGDGRDARALLGRNTTWPAGRFSTLAGFVEPGESLEAAVAREVREEAGISIADVRYVASQPWPFPSSLMVGFLARVDGDPTPHCDTDELSEAYWFTRDELQAAADRTDAGAPNSGVDDRDSCSDVLRMISGKISISRYLIDVWLAAQ